MNSSQDTAVAAVSAVAADTAVAAVSAIAADTAVAAVSAKILCLGLEVLGQT